MSDVQRVNIKPQVDEYVFLMGTQSSSFLKEDC